jgi:outer membrane receptor protein involved in Fe transport
MKIARLFSVVVLCALMVPAQLRAGTTGKISGVVRDAKSSEPIPGVNVVIKGSTLGCTSDINGRYVLLNVPPGAYTVTASYVGYRRFQADGVGVSVDFTTTLDIALEEGSVELDAIVVQGERTPLIRKDLTNPVASISAENISSLPVTEISEVIGLQAGVTVGDDGVLHIRGGLGNEVNYTLNGVTVNNPFSNTRAVGIATNAVREVSVSSGTFNAEYGSALSGVVNYVTRDGGPKWSGGFKVLSGDHVSSHSSLFNNIDKITPNNVYRMEGSIGGPLAGDDLTLFVSGVHSYYGGHLYGQQIYLPTDSYLSRDGFPTNDPRKGSASSAYYFGPLVHPTSDLVGLPSGDNSIVPLNWSRSYNILANLALRLGPQMKLKYEYVMDYTKSPSSSGNSDPFTTRYKPDGRALVRSEGWMHSLELTHTVNSRLFYTVKGSYIINRTRSMTYDNPTDPRYLPTFYLQSFPNLGFLTGGVDLDRSTQKTVTFAGKFDLVAQMWGNHELKIGLEARKHTLSYEAYTLQFHDPTNLALNPSVSNVLINGGHFVPYIPTPTGGYVSYDRKPLQLAAYVQDKIELFKSIIVNLGVRYEYFDAAANFNNDISGEFSLQDTIFLVKNLTKASVKNMVSPRLSLAFPITDQGTIRFSYGHFYQIGSLSSLYRNPFFRAPLGTTPSFGNPNVNPQKSIQYEIGLQQGLTEDLKVEVTGYYKDVNDYIYSQQIITANGDKSYYLLTNLSYANTRGLSISLVKRRSADGLLSATLDYTYQVAEGNRTAPTDELFYNEQAGKLSETYEVPFSFDRSHTLTSTVALSRPEDWQISMIGYLRTGTPYTPSFPSSVVPITFIQNSDRQMMQWNVDLKLEKFFRFSGLTWSVYLQVDNLFDTENEIAVYANSGRALYNILQTLQPQLLSDMRNRITRGDPGLIPMSAVDNYYANPENIGMPRLVRLGASLSF